VIWLAAAIVISSLASYVLLAFIDDA